MNTRMPIAQAILNGKRGTRGHEKDIDNLLFTPEMGRLSMDYTSKFDVHVASDLANAGHGFMAGREIIRPPFPNMWMEWSADHLLDGKTITLDMACLLMENVEGSHNPLLDLIEFPLPIGWNMIFYLSKEGNRHSYISLGLGTTLTLNDEGQFVEWNHLFSLGAESAEGSIERGVKYIEHVAIPPIVALTLINCKNVKTESNGRVSVARTGNQKRRGQKQAIIRYNTIVLPGGGSEWTGGASGTQRATAIHRVRGHFKTFTAEKPLLGQHVGTYWWGWQVRGKAENGIVISDYKVGVK